MLNFRCVNETEQAKVIEEIHFSECGSHLDGKILANIILRHRYFWLMFRTDTK